MNSLDDDVFPILNGASKWRVEHQPDKQNKDPFINQSVQYIFIYIYTYSIYIYNIYYEPHCVYIHIWNVNSSRVSPTVAITLPVVSCMFFFSSPLPGGGRSLLGDTMITEVDVCDGAGLVGWWWVQGSDGRLKDLGGSYGYRIGTYRFKSFLIKDI